MKLALAHLFGDYVVQTDHMARHKVATPESPEGRLEAAQHALTYTACHLPVTRNWKALTVIGGTHYVIDRYRLAKYVVWARNQIAPAESRYPLHEAGPFGQKMSPTEKDGYLYKKGHLIADGPDWLNGWLLFICDNSIHLAINYWATEKWK
jgi:hypothetical protein